LSLFLFFDLGCDRGFLIVSDLLVYLASKRTGRGLRKLFNALAMRLAADGSDVPQIIPKHYKQFDVDFLSWGKF
jgi:hypothetical protein